MCAPVRWLMWRSCLALATVVCSFILCACGTPELPHFARPGEPPRAVDAGMLDAAEAGIPDAAEGETP